MKKNGFPSLFPRGRRLKILMTMKMIVFLSLVLSLTASASIYSQNQRVNLDFQGVSVLEVFNEIKAQTGLRFIYNEDKIEEIGAINFDATDMRVDEALKEIFKVSSLECQFHDDVIMIVDRTPEAPKDQQEKKYLKGTVTDKDGNTLPGVSVVEKGTTNGVATDFDGNYIIQLENDNAVLVFSFVGTLPQEVVYKRQEEINIVLKEDSEALDEVVVTGYQEIKRERMAGSVKTITAANMKNKGVQSIDEILEGNIAGLTSIASGRPGEDAQITIRGVNSLGGNRSPMWIVDGMPMQGNFSSDVVDIESTLLTTGIGNITPDDVKSITILKDAAATAIYGSRAANGVVVIETKSGHVGKTYFNFSSNFSLTEKPSSNIRMMNSAEKVNYEKLLFEDLGRPDNLGRAYEIWNKIDMGQISEKDGMEHLNQLTNTNTDWFDEIFNTAFSQQYNFNMSGGSDATQYYASVNYSDEEGTIPNNNYEKMGLNLKLTHNPNKKTRVIVGLSGVNRIDRSSASIMNPLEYAMYANPYETPYNEDGTYAYDLSYNTRPGTVNGEYKWGKFNILHDLNNNTKESDYVNLSANFKFEYEVVSGLMFTSSGIYSLTNNTTTVEQKEDTYTNFVNSWTNEFYSYELPYELVEGSLQENQAKSTAYTFRNTLTFNREFKGVHFVNAFLGQEMSSNKSNSFYNYSPVYNDVHRVIGFPDLEGVQGNSIDFNRLGGTSAFEEKSSSFFGNFSYSYDDRYVISGSARYDGSDIIGNQNQFTPLWNVGMRWNMHNEAFLSDSKVLTFCSLKGGFGYTGSIDKNALPFLIMNLDQKVKYEDVIVPTSYTASNPNIKWQTKQEKNIGVELGFFKRRINIDFNYYYNVTKDVLEYRRLAMSSGRSTVKENVADIINKGWELELNSINVSTKDFTWSTKFTLAFNNNTVEKSYYENLDDVPASNRRGYVEGYPVNAIYGYKFAGIDPANGRTLVYTPSGETFDLDRTNSLTLNLEKPAISYLGDGYPPYVGGFSTTFRYKNFSLMASTEFKMGHKIRSFNTAKMVDSRNRYIMDQYRWRQPGDMTNIPVTIGDRNASEKYMFDSKLERGDYLRCNLVSLGYNVDQALVKKLGFKAIRIHANARNLFTISKYNGIDPVLMGSFGYPNSRKYTLSVNLSF